MLLKFRARDMDHLHRSKTKNIVWLKGMNLQIPNNRPTLCQSLKASRTAIGLNIAYFETSKFLLNRGRADLLMIRP